MNERIKRRRNSSRCSRNDICPPSSSSLDLLLDRALRIADITNKFKASRVCAWALVDHLQRELPQRQRWVEMSAGERPRDRGSQVLEECYVRLVQRELIECLR